MLSYDGPVHHLRAANVWRVGDIVLLLVADDTLGVAAGSGLLAVGTGYGGRFRGSCGHECVGIFRYRYRIVVMVIARLLRHGPVGAPKRPRHLRTVARCGPARARNLA